MSYIFLFFILFQNIFLGFLSATGVWSYWDEICFMISVLIYAYFLWGRKIGKAELVILSGSIGVVLVGLFGNMIFDFQSSYSAVFRDIVGFLKFPLTVIIFLKLKFTDSLALAFHHERFLMKGIIVIMFIFGVASLFTDLGMSQLEVRGGIHPYMFLYTHPTYLTTGLICLLCLLNADKQLNFSFEAIILVTILLGMRTKGLVFIAIYLFSRYGIRWLKKFPIIYWIGVLVLVIAVSYTKLLGYAASSGSPRESMYAGAFQLIRSCFPIGSGFGTFASTLSTDPLSRVYGFIPIAGMYNSDGTVTTVFGDAGLPYYFAQFGIIGIGLIVLVISYLVRMTRSMATSKRWAPVLMLWLMILISIPSESLLVNDGFQLGLIIAIAVRLITVQYSDEIQPIPSSLKS